MVNGEAACCLLPCGSRVCPEKCPKHGKSPGIQVSQGTSAVEKGLSTGKSAALIFSFKSSDPAPRLTLGSGHPRSHPMALGGGCHAWVFCGVTL